VTTLGSLRLDPLHAAGGGSDGGAGVTIENLDRGLLIGSAVLIVAIVAVRVASRTALPSLLLYLALGVVLGQDVIGIEFDDTELTRTLGYAALVIILAEGGLTTHWRTIRPSIPAAAMLATVGVGVSVVITARSCPRPTRPRSSRSCGCCRSGPGWSGCWRPSPGSTTPRSSS